MTGRPASVSAPPLFDEAVEKLTAVKAEIGRAVIGQDRVVERTLIALLSGGHALLVGVPGLAKTLLVETMGTVLSLSSNRIQCTPDLMPADIIGTEVLEEKEPGKRSFRFIEGPVFTQLLMADEINRASPRTQSALLQAMQEREVSAGGKKHALPAPFHVLATQNPIEHEGTYPLPEAQLDRFLLQVDVDYPAADTERRIMLETTSNENRQIKAILDKNDLQAFQRLVRDMPVGETVVEATLTLVRRARPGPDAPDLVNAHVQWAPGPRASQALMLACRAKALLDRRETPSVEDVLELAEPVLKHRMALGYRARSEGIALPDILREITKGL